MVEIEAAPLSALYGFVVSAEPDAAGTVVDHIRVEGFQGCFHLLQGLVAVPHSDQRDHDALPHRYRWLLLLVASYVFYTWWEPAYGLLLLGSTTVDYVLARAMGARETRRARRPLLAVSLLSNFGLLFAFKYFDFAGRSGAAP